MVDRQDDELDGQTGRKEGNDELNGWICWADIDRMDVQDGWTWCIEEKDEDVHRIEWTWWIDSKVGEDRWTRWVNMTDIQEGWIGWMYRMNEYYT
jgi:hypothetical protein